MSFILLLIGGMFAFIKLSRLGLPEAHAAGHWNDASVGFAFVAVALVLRWLGQRWFLLIFPAGIALATIFSIANWWYFEFYRDYITADLLLLANSAVEASWSLPGLSHKLDAALFLVLMGLLIWALSRASSRQRTRDVILLAPAVLSAGLTVYFAHSYEKKMVRGLAHSGYHHISFFFSDLLGGTHRELLPEHIEAVREVLGRDSLHPQYPLYDSASGTTRKPARTPNIILVVLESFRAAEMGVYGAESSVSPNLDAIAKEGLVFNRFYANSNQTVRGEMALLCSALDYANGAPFSVSNQLLKTKCLPKLLTEYGYETHWFHGYEKSFFNRESFMPQAGYQHVHDIEAVYGETAPDDRKKLGWGAPDVLTFEHALNRLEQAHNPFFAEILTLSNHYPFDWEWPIEYPSELGQGEGTYGNYRKGMYYTDHAVGEFWSRFKQSRLAEDTLVIFAADHGIWTFSPEQQEAPESVRYETYFRLPFIVVGPDILPGVVESSPRSQVDLAPTVLDYLGLDAPNAFLGASVFSDSKERPIFMIAGGTYGYTIGNTLCYPKSVLCADSAYQSCNEKLRLEADAHGHACVTHEGDLLRHQHGTMAESTLDTHRLYQLFDFTQVSLERGLWPPDQL